MVEGPDLQFLRARIDKLQSESVASAPLPTGGGGDNSGGMESRIAKLEADVAHMVGDIRDARDSLKGVQESLAQVRERMVAVEIKLDHLPGKGFVVAVVTTGLALLTAFLLFQDKLQHALGLTMIGK